MKRRFFPTWGLAIGLFVLFATSGLAQNGARIEGVVTDESKASIAGANVTLLNTKTGIRVLRQTSDTGLYVFDLVEPGDYTVTIEAAGFTKFIQENITAEMRADITVNATLKTGSVHYGRRNSGGRAVQLHQPGSHTGFHHGRGGSALRSQPV
jgi:hypothetical protein